MNFEHGENAKLVTSPLCKLSFNKLSLCFLILLLPSPATAHTRTTATLVATFTLEPAAINFPHGDVVAHVTRVWSRTSESSQKNIGGIVSSSSSPSLSLRVVATVVFVFFALFPPSRKSSRTHTDPPKGCTSKRRSRSSSSRGGSDNTLTPSRHLPLNPRAVSSFIVF